jgi:opacity protein-like surface antigen
VLLSSEFIHAQTTKGTWLLGGNASFQSIDEESVFTLNPNLGYFVADRFAVGLNAGFTKFNELTTLSLGPYLKGYFLTSERGSLFAAAGFDYTNISLPGSNSFSGTGYNIGAGYAVFLNSSIALELGAKYSRLGSSDDNVISGDSSTGIFSMNVGFQIHFNKN